MMASGSGTALMARGTPPCIPQRHTNNLNVQYHSKGPLPPGHKIENAIGRLKAWCRVATRSDRCAYTFMSAISSAATGCY